MVSRTSSPVVNVESAGADYVFKILTDPVLYKQKYEELKEAGREAKREQDRATELSDQAIEDHGIAEARKQEADDAVAAMETMKANLDVREAALNVKEVRLDELEKTIDYKSTVLQNKTDQFNRSVLERGALEDTRDKEWNTQNEMLNTRKLELDAREDEIRRKEENLASRIDQIQRLLPSNSGDLLHG